MGLAEKRSAKEFEENNLPEFQKKINDLVGKEIPLEINWEQLAVDGQSHNYQNFWPSVYFQPLVDAVAEICADDMGKEALNDNLEKIVIKNEADCSNADKWAAFEAKTITLDHAADRNIDNIDARKTSLQTLIEGSL